LCLFLNLFNDLANGIGNDATISGGTGVTGSGTQGGDGGDGANIGGAGGAGGNDVNGNPGSPPGGGGGGSGGRNNLGAAGADGQIIITYTVGSVCTLTASGITNITCNNNLTPDNPTDDTFTFDLNPTGTDPGASYNITGDVIDSGSYGAATTFGPYPISGGNLNITITDVSGNCSIGETVTAPATCSPDCSLTSSGLTNINCNNNGTPTIPGDDIFSFDLNPIGNNLGTTYSVSGAVTQVGVSYGLATTFQWYNISDGNLSITITDDTDGSCTIIETVTAPAPCSAPICNLTTSGLASITCNNNGTSSDPADDTFSFTLNPTGTLLGATYNVSGDITQAGIPYGSATNFSGYLISAGNLSITITDVSTDCSFGPFTVTAPAPCSNGCNLASSGLSNIFCNYETTVLNDGDDTFSFTLNPVGTNLGATYSVNGSVTQSGISYGSATTFSGYLITAGDLTITITDDADGACQIVDLLVTAPAPCSQNHEITECSSCHITHSSPGSSLTTVAGNALLCQSCHLSSGLASTKPLVNANKASEAGGAKNSHSWDVPADNSAGFQTTVPNPTSEMGMRLPSGNIVCSTCHNQHKNGSAGPPYLRVDNTGDAMCKECHLVRDVQRFQDGATNKGSHPVGIVYDGAASKLKATPTNTQLVGGKVECSSCHGVHDVTNSGVLTTDGNLLRATNDINLCTDCHNYPTHNGMDCLDCHEVHNTVDGIIGDNIFMIKDQIIVTTPAPASINASVVLTAESGVGSFVDTVGGDDGICEVCHTTTTHHTSDGGNTTHDDTSDKRGSNCVGCHFHNVGFETPSGPLTCIGCHSVATTGPRLGTVQIVGTGGEFDNTYPSRHTASGIGVDPDIAECEACHYDSGVAHPTSQMMLRDPDAAAVFPGSDTDVYCVQCHDGDAPISPVDFSYINTATYNKASYIGTPHDNSANSCLGCHETHGSQYTALTMQATNYENCFACHDGGVASTTISAADIATPGTSGTGHAFNVPANSGNYQSNTPSDPTMVARLDSGNIVCSTCHDPHANTNGKLLVSPNSADEMCKDCHDARNIGRFTAPATNIGSHPVGLTYVAGGDYVDPAPTLSSIQVGLVNGKIECSSCHSAHNATTTDGNLLKETMTSATCKECHNYKPHRGFDCLDCHQSHNTGTNIMLVKSTVNGFPVVFKSQGTTASPAQASLNSFADGVGTIDGICEVCHDPAFDGSPLIYHTSDGSDGTDHNDGKDCTGCHAHNDATESFPQGSCHECHEKTAANDPQLFPNTGSHQVHAEKYRYTCATCHYQYGDGGVLEGAHSNGSVDVNFEPNGMAFRNGQDGNTPTWNSGAKTCDNIYCHSNGITAQRTEGGTPLISWATPPIAGAAMTYQTTPAWDVTPGTGINTCYSCHQGIGNMTGDYKITVATGVPVNDAIYYPLAGQHQKGSHQSNSQELKSSPTKANPWGGVQCFWCHNVGNKQTTPISGIDPTNNYQGTYGFSGTNGDIPMELHNDGETWFYPRNVSGHAEGTVVDDIAGRSWDGGHCGASSSCWQ